MSFGDGLDLTAVAPVVSNVFNTASVPMPEGAAPAPGAEPAVQVAANGIWTPADSAARAGVYGLPATAENKALGLQNMQQRLGGAQPSLKILIPK
jgi:hypothetical protein